LFLRNPDEHALSTYTHRAKSGKLNSFDEWLSNDYETLGLLESFVEAKRESSIIWYLRKYNPSLKPLEEVVFSDYLHVESRLEKPRQVVNESILLSEVQLVNVLERKSPGLGRIVSGQLRNIPKSEKQPDTNLRKATLCKTRDFFMNHNELIEKLNQALPLEERLKLQSFNHPLSYDKNQNMDDDCINLSQKQLEALSEGFRLYNISSISLKNVLDRKLKSIANKLKRRFRAIT